MTTQKKTAKSSVASARSKGVIQVIEPDYEGKITCPLCGKRYTPKLRRKDDRLIQEQYPDASPAEREELISGICQKCQPSIFGEPGSLFSFLGTETHKRPSTCARSS